MSKARLDQLLVIKGLVSSRSQAESWIGLGKVTVDGRVATKSGQFVSEDADIRFTAKEQYVSRAGLKLASVAKLLEVDFRGKTVLDVGSSTGGFTDYALQHGAAKVIAVDVGTDQLHPSLHGDKRIELHEKTDIRNIVNRSVESSDEGMQPKSFQPNFQGYLQPEQQAMPGLDLMPGAKPSLEISAEDSERKVFIDDAIDIVVIDVSFISLREILPSVARIAPQAQVMAMVKPQFEAGRDQINKGIIKNDAVRRKILQDFEQWAKKLFIIQGKRDSEVAGSKGNRERFYLLKSLWYIDKIYKISYNNH